MPKPYKGPTASYYLRESKPNEAWSIAKFAGGGGGDGEAPQNTYTLTQTPHGVFCDCPAASKGYGRHSSKVVCKHVNIFTRWRKIHLEGKVPQGTTVYYDSGRDHFYPVRSLDFSGDISLDTGIGN
jgi:hypothetical protein